MRETKLIKLLQIVEKKELKRLIKYVRGPYFTEDESVIRLFDYIVAYYPTFDTLDLDKGIVYKHLFPSKKYDDIVLRHLRSKLLKIIEQYLIQIYFEQNTIEKKRLLTEIFSKRNYYAAFEKSSKSLLKEIKNQSTQHPAYLFQTFSLSEKLYFHPLTDFDKHTDYLKDAINSLEQFYFLERTKLVIEIKTRERIYAEKYDTPLVPNYLPKSGSVSQNLLAKISELVDKNDESLYYEAKEFLYTNTKLLSNEHNQLAYRVLTNYIVQRMNKEYSMIKEYLELTNWSIETSVSLSNNIISDITYINYIIVSLKINDYEGCRKFQDAYQGLLEYEIRDSIVTLADSLVLYKKKEYGKALLKLSKLKINITLHDIIVRTLLLKTYYHLVELGDTTYIQPLLTACNTFKTYLKRAKLSQRKKSGHLIFISILIKITKHYFIVNNPSQFEKLIETLYSSEPIVSREWLKQQIKKQDN